MALRNLVQMAMLASSISAPANSYCASSTTDSLSLPLYFESFSYRTRTNTLLMIILNEGESEAAPGLENTVDEDTSH